MGNKRKNSPVSHPVSVEYKGKQYSGTYTVEKGLVYLSSPHGSKGTQLGNSSAESIAAQLLFQLVADFRNP
jgi:hypothetical protein